MNAAVELLESEIETLEGYLDSSPKREHLPVLEKLVADYREALRVLQGWQPIETAPKLDEFGVSETYLIAKRLGEVCPVIRGIVHNNAGRNDWTFGEQATHWQPLPSPPVAS